MIELLGIYSPELKSHSVEVGMLAREIGIMTGYPEPALLWLAGIAHDVGKLSVPRSILYKPGPLSRQELEIIRKHPETGYEGMKDSGIDPRILDAIRYHHERPDGTGYPFGMTDIPLEARIVATADVYSALREPRPYHPQLGHRDAMTIMASLPLEYLKEMDQIGEELCGAGLQEAVVGCRY